MKNRKLPFGYALHGGEIVINQSEANAVGDIFRLYTGGTSLSGIAEVLRSSEISYDAGRLWNKNMVSRILGDRRYVESTVYPPRRSPRQDILPPTTFRFQMKSLRRTASSTFISRQTSMWILHSGHLSAPIRMTIGSTSTPTMM